MKIEILFLLFAAHALCDFPLQGDYMARAKNRHMALGVGVWPIVLTMHALIHGGAVFLITGSLVWGLYEVATHWIIDFWKCDNKITFGMDQTLHLLSKIVIWGLIL